MSAIIDHDLLSVQEARILAEQAAYAQSLMAPLTQEDLDRVVEAIAEEMDRHAEELARLSARESGCGRWQDKVVKNRFVCRCLREKLRGMRCVGVIARDREACTMDVGVPKGAIAAFCPATSPVSTTIYKAMIAVKSGNSIVFAPPPRAHAVAERTLDILIETAEKAGLPHGAISYMATVAPLGIRELMGHEAVATLLLTGTPELLEDARRCGKTVLYGGAGNGPVFVERTADIEQAARDIVQSKSFDCGAVSAAEQAVVVDAPVAHRFRRALEQAGAYFMTPEEAAKLAKRLFLPCGELSQELIGRSAEDLADVAGFTLPAGTRLLVAEQDYVSPRNPYNRTSLSPVLSYYVEDDWQQACEKCIELLLSERHGHTLVIHSRDEEVIRQFALKKPVARILVNTPATLGGMGLTTNLFPAMTLGSGQAGLGETADNVSPMNLIYIRKVGCGVRSLEDLFPGSTSVPDEKPVTCAPDPDLVQRIVEKIVQELH